jgi:hypothetical protein
MLEKYHRAAPSSQPHLRLPMEISQLFDHFVSPNLLTLITD